MLNKNMPRYRSTIQMRAMPQYISLRTRWRRAFLAAFRGGCWFALCFGIGSAAYLTCKRNSNLRTEWWIPYPIAVWADYHGRARNLVAYAVLALPVMALFRDHRKQFAWLAFLGLLGSALEYCQLFIPTRWFEWQDIALSLAGLAMCWIAVEGSLFIVRRLRPAAYAKQPNRR
jgi:hypothetical protein